MVSCHQVLYQFATGKTPCSGALVFLVRHTPTFARACFSLIIRPVLCSSLHRACLSLSLPRRPLCQSEWQLERSTMTHPNCNLAIVGDPIRYFAGVLYYVQDFTDRCALLLLSLP